MQAANCDLRVSPSSGEKRDRQGKPFRVGCRLVGCRSRPRRASNAKYHAPYPVCRHETSLGSCSSHQAALEWR